MDSPTKIYKTPEYQRRAYKKWANKKMAEGDDFKEKRRQAQSDYYYKNREKILEKMKAKREAKKANQNVE
tara:strand:+ start:555 stop:764 length:210 start_codon:yes stop_codon:yes gene_type:complete